MQIKKKKFSDYKLDDRNINQGSEYGDSLMEKSLREVGLGRSVLADKNGVFIAGNKTFQKAGELGFDEIIEVETTGRQLVVVKRKDIDINSPEGIKMKILDNTVSKHNYVEDAEVAEALCEDAQIEPANYGLETKEPIVEEDAFEGQAPKKPITKAGDLYEMDRHRFICGDSCDPETVKKTLNDCKPILMITDPPYGVNYDPAWRDDIGWAENRARGKVENDDQLDWSKAYIHFPGDIMYIWHAGRYAGEVADQIKACGFTIYYQIIWSKPHFPVGRGDYHWRHEPCYYAVRNKKGHNWQGSRKENTVWEIGNNIISAKGGGSEDKTGHGTQKPVECMARPIRNNTNEGQQVYDPFLGSGTTIIAAEQLNRACYGQEIDPGYCDLILARFAKFKQDSGASFEIRRNGKVLGEKDILKYIANTSK